MASRSVAYYSFVVLALSCSVFYAIGARNRREQEVEEILAQDQIVNLTKAMQLIYPSLIAGIPKLGVDGSESIQMDIVKGILPKFNYTLYDATMTGFKDCRIEKAELGIANSKLIINMICPSLVMETSNCVAVGKIDSFDVDGRGRTKVTHDDYHITIIGTIDGIIDINRKKIMNLKIKSFKLDMDVLERVIYELDPMFLGNNNKASLINAYLNENWREINKRWQGPGMHSFMGKFIENMNNFFKVTSIEDVLLETSENEGESFITGS